MFMCNRSEPVVGSGRLCKSGDQRLIDLLLPADASANREK